MPIKNYQSENTLKSISLRVFVYVCPCFFLSSNVLNANKNYDAFVDIKTSMQEPQSTMVLTCIISKNYNWIAIKMRIFCFFFQKKRLHSLFFSSFFFSAHVDLISIFLFCSNFLVWPPIAFLRGKKLCS